MTDVGKQKYSLTSPDRQLRLPHPNKSPGIPTPRLDKLYSGDSLHFGANKSKKRAELYQQLTQILRLIPQPEYKHGLPKRPPVERSDFIQLLMRKNNPVHVGELLMEGLRRFNFNLDLTVSGKKNGPLATMLSLVKHLDDATFETLLNCAITLKTLGVLKGEGQFCEFASAFIPGDLNHGKPDPYGKQVLKDYLKEMPARIEPYLKLLKPPGSLSVLFSEAAREFLLEKKVLKGDQNRYLPPLVTRYTGTFESYMNRWFTLFKDFSNGLGGKGTLPLFLHLAQLSDSPETLEQAISWVLPAFQPKNGHPPDAALLTKVILRNQDLTALPVLLGAIRAYPPVQGELQTFAETFNPVELQPEAFWTTFGVHPPLDLKYQDAPAHKAYRKALSLVMDRVNHTDGLAWTFESFLKSVETLADWALSLPHTIEESRKWKLIRACYWDVAVPEVPTKVAAQVHTLFKGTPPIPAEIANAMALYLEHVKDPERTARAKDRMIAFHTQVKAADPSGEVFRIFVEALTENDCHGGLDDAGIQAWMESFSSLPPGEIRQSVLAVLDKSHHFRNAALALKLFQTLPEHDRRGARLKFLEDWLETADLQGVSDEEAISLLNACFQTPEAPHMNVIKAMMPTIHQTRRLFDASRFLKTLPRETLPSKELSTVLQHVLHSDLSRGTEEDLENAAFHLLLFPQPGQSEVYRHILSETGNLERVVQAQRFLEAYIQENNDRSDMVTFKELLAEGHLSGLPKEEVQWFAMYLAEMEKTVNGSVLPPARLRKTLFLLRALFREKETFKSVAAMVMRLKDPGDWLPVVEFMAFNGLPDEALSQLLSEKKSGDKTPLESTAWAKNIELMTLVNEPDRFLNHMLMNAAEIHPAVLTRILGKIELHPKKTLGFGLLPELMALQTPYLSALEGAKKITPQEKAALTNQLSSALTRLYDYRTGSAATQIRNIQGVVLNTWSRVGALGLAFSKWQFDAMRPWKGHGPMEKATLLEQSGMFTRVGSRKDDHSYHKGFLYYDPAEQLSIELRRAYLVVSKPGLGTLVVRNSSPVFGRDKLQEPAYFHPTRIYGQSENLFSPDRDIRESRFESVLGRTLNRTPAGQVENHEKIQALMTAFEQVMDRYVTWKCGFSKGKAPEGFRELVNYVLMSARNSGVGTPFGGQKNIRMVWVPRYGLPVSLKVYDASGMKHQEELGFCVKVLSRKEQVLKPAEYEAKIPDFLAFMREGLSKGWELVLKEAPNNQKED